VENPDTVADGTGVVSFESVSDATSLGVSSAKIVYNSTTGEIVYNPTTTAGDETVLANLDPGLDIQGTDFEVFG
jgi:hypothetical protein